MKYLAAMVLLFVCAAQAQINTMPIVSAVTATNPTYTLTFAWAPSADIVTGYHIYIGTNSGSYFRKVTVGNVTACTVTGLTFPVYAVCAAYNGSGDESPFSNESFTEGYRKDIKWIAQTSPTANGVFNDAFVVTNTAGTNALEFLRLRGETKTVLVTTP